MKGKWYLTFVTFDILENRVSTAKSIERHELKSTTEEHAIQEGVELWEKHKGNPFTGWDKEIYPHSPCIVYEIKLT